MTAAEVSFAEVSNVLSEDKQKQVIALAPRSRCALRLTDIAVNEALLDLALKRNVGLYDAAI